MTGRETRDEFERELTAGLERLAPKPRRDAAERTMRAVAETPQRSGWSVGLSRFGALIEWPRAVAVGAVAVVALVVGIAIGTSGLLPSGNDGSPTPAPSVPPSSSTPASSGWTPVQVDPTAGTGDLVIQDGYASSGGVVLTGQLAGPLADAAGGVAPVAWFSADGVGWLRADVEASGSGLTAYEIGPVFEVGGELRAFGTGQVDGSGEPTAVLFASHDGGRTWTIPQQDLPPGGYVRGVVPYQGGYIAVGATSAQPTQPVVWISSDGTAWQSIPLVNDQGTIFGSLAAATSDGREVVAAGSLGPADGPTRATVMTTLDGRTWTVGEAPAGAQLMDLAFYASAYHMVGVDDAGPAEWWSGDGYSWRREEIDAPAGVRGLTAIAHGASGLVAVGDGVDHAVAWASISGQRWNPGEVLGTEVGLRVVLATPTGVLVAGNTTATSGGRLPVAWIERASVPPEPSSTPAPTAGVADTFATWTRIALPDPAPGVHGGDRCGTRRLTTPFRWRG